MQALEFDTSSSLVTRLAINNGIHRTDRWLQPVGESNLFSSCIVDGIAVLAADRLHADQMLAFPPTLTIIVSTH